MEQLGKNCCLWFNTRSKYKQSLWESYLNPNILFGNWILVVGDQSKFPSIIILHERRLEKANYSIRTEGLKKILTAW